MGVQHTLLREFQTNSLGNGAVLSNDSEESAFAHANGTKGVTSYKGTNQFTISFNHAMKGAGKLADLIWTFFLERLDNYNEPFYFYNPTECDPPDPTGVETRGRYLVKLKDPNQALTREYFRSCLYKYGLVLIEYKEFVDEYGEGEGEIDEIDLLYMTFWQEAVDVWHGRIALAGQQNNWDYEYGAGAVERVDGEWYGLGLALGFSHYMDPNTCRIAGEDYVAYFGTWYCGDKESTDPADDYNVYVAGVIVFSLFEYPRLTPIWTVDYYSQYSEDSSPYGMFGDSVHYNAMDCVGTRIACVAQVVRDHLDTINCVQVRISDDSGLTFPKKINLPNSSPGQVWMPTPVVRMSEDGVVWVGILYNDDYQTGYDAWHIIELWKSNADATSFSKIYVKDYFSDLHDQYPSGMMFDISDDGVNVCFRLEGWEYSDDPGWSAIIREAIYESRNGGASFNTHLNDYHYGAIFYPNTDFAPYYRVGTANGPYIVHGASLWYDADHPIDTHFEIVRSTDYGANFTELDISPIPISDQYVDQQKHHGEIVWVECGESFIEEGPGADFNGVVYSDDNGATWEIVTSNLPTDSESTRGIPFYPGVTEVATYRDGEVYVTITYQPLNGDPEQKFYWNSEPGLVWLGPRKIQYKPSWIRAWMAAHYAE